MLSNQQFRRGSMRRESFIGFDEYDARGFTQKATAHGHFLFGITPCAIETFQERLHFAFVSTHDSDVGGRTIRSRFFRGWFLCRAFAGVTHADASKSCMNCTSASTPSSGNAL